MYLEKHPRSAVKKDRHSGDIFIECFWGFSLDFDNSLIFRLKSFYSDSIAESLRF